MMLLQTVPSSDLTAVNALILGIVEGVTEFLPVSSTAHLILAARVLNIVETEYVKSFQVIIQFGAILAVVVLYWSKFWNLEVFKKLVVAFIPTGVIGMTLYKVIKGYLFGSMAVILWTLLIGGVALIIFERFRKQEDLAVDFAEITYKKALLIGLFQSVAMVPGVSRSAATIVGGALIGISKRTIVEFSFMLAVPTMLAASVLDLIKSHEALTGHFGALAIGFVVSFITAIIAIKSFLAFLKKRDFSAFGWYRIALAIVFFFLFVR
jgi:undecaprenyl-diphosphatase